MLGASFTCGPDTPLLRRSVVRMEADEPDPQPSGEQRFWPWLLFATIVLLLIILPLIVAL